jgi:hypothetical protein
MRLLILETPIYNGESRFEMWAVAYVLPFAAVGAARYGPGDMVTLRLVDEKECSPREMAGRLILQKHTETVAQEMGRPLIVEEWCRRADIEAYCARGVTLKWLTDHKRREDANT